MSRGRLRLLALAALVLPSTPAGCDRAAPEVPRADLSSAGRYAVAEFKDDAPANATLSPGDFPLAFVDSDGSPVDLTRYRGRRKVVLVVLRGVPRSERGGFCPSCLAQVSSLMANREQFAARGAEVLVVFPGRAERL